MSNLILTTPYRVTSADTDMYARLRLGALVNILIQAAIESADQLGFGFEAFKVHKLFWVASRFTVEIERPLTWNEACEAETWPKDLDKLLYLRDFFIRDEKGETIVKATSGWLAVDAVARVPKLIEGVADSMFTELRDRHGIKAHPDKLGPVHGEEVSVNKVTYFDLDVNRHVTSTRYFDWMMDTFTPDFHKKNYPKRVSINFMKEIRFADEVQLIRQDCGENVFAFEGINKTREVVAFRGKISF
jgi:medium-chain acyl-[acyl-carrier-protein] hydrolase